MRFPRKVEFCLFRDNYFVVENINDEAVDITLDSPHTFLSAKHWCSPEDGGNAEFSQSGNGVKIQISPRTLVAVEYWQLWKR
jgi:hypothetical protein